MALTGYKVVRAEDLGALEARVLELAGDGYVPYGAVSEKDGTFYQGMIQGDVAGGASSLGAAAVNVEAGTDGLAAGTAQATFQDIYTNMAALPASDVTVEAGTDGLAAGSAQEALQALATRIAVLEGG